MQIVDGYFEYESESFIVRGVKKHAVIETYQAADLRALAKSIEQEFSLVIDNERSIRLSVEDTVKFKRELLLIADELDN